MSKPKLIRILSSIENQMIQMNMIKAEKFIELLSKSFDNKKNPGEMMLHIRDIKKRVKYDTKVKRRYQESQMLNATKQFVKGFLKSTKKMEFFSVLPVEELPFEELSGEDYLSDDKSLDQDISTQITSDHERIYSIASSELDFLSEDISVCQLGLQNQSTSSRKETLYDSPSRFKEEASKILQINLNNDEVNKYASKNESTQIDPVCENLTDQACEVINISSDDTLGRSLSNLSIDMLSFSNDKSAEVHKTNVPLCDRIDKVDIAVISDGRESALVSENSSSILKMTADIIYDYDEVLERKTPDDVSLSEISLFNESGLYPLQVDLCRTVDVIDFDYLASQKLSASSQTHLQTTNENVNTGACCRRIKVTSKKHCVIVGNETTRVHEIHSQYSTDLLENDNQNTDVQLTTCIKTTPTDVAKIPNVKCRNSNYSQTGASVISMSASRDLRCLPSAEVSKFVVEQQSLEELHELKPQVQAFPQNNISSMANNDTTNFSPLLALRRFTQADVNFDKSSETLMRVTNSNFDQLYVIRKLRNENDLENFCGNQISGRSKLFQHQSGTKQLINIKQLPLHDLKEICENNHKNNINEIINNSPINRKTKESFTLQKISNIEENQMEINCHQVDIEISEDQEQKSRFNVARIASEIKVTEN